MYFCRDNLLLASFSSNLFSGSLDIISNRVFFRIGFSLESLTLNSSMFTIMITCHVLDICDTLVVEFRMNEFIPNYSQAEYNGFDIDGSSSMNFRRKIQPIIFAFFVGDRCCKLNDQCINVIGLKVAEIDVGGSVAVDDASICLFFYLLNDLYHN